MFHQNMNIFKILTFEKKNYTKIIKAIKDSRGYISYIDSKKDTGKINPRYERYVKLKQAAYTVNQRKLNQDPDPNSIYNVIMSDQINIERIDEFIDTHGTHNDFGTHDDFEYETKVEVQDDGSFMTIHQINPIEYSVYNTALDIDDTLERLDRAHLNENFLLKNVQRFILPPFLAKHNGNYVKPFIIANVYDVGVITIQVSISFNKDNVEELKSTPPNKVMLEELQFNKLKKNYNSKDFWLKDKTSKGSIYDVLDYYENFLINICETSKLQKEKEHQISWVFGDFEINKRPDHKDFVNENKRFYVSYLLNAGKEFIERITDEDINEILTNSSLINNKNMHFYCSESVSLLSFSYSAFHKSAVDLLKDKKSELKKEGIYDSSLMEIYNDHLLFDMFEFLRYYELTFIKKFYSLRMLNEISNENFKTITDYNKIRKEFNSLKINYDEQILFPIQSSPRYLYSKLLLKSGTNKLLDKVEIMLANAREDINSSREVNIKKTETYILIMTSILTILLGYGGIKLIVYDILTSISSFGIGQLFSAHPLRWTITLWFTLCIIMILLNIIRYRANK